MNEPQEPTSTGTGAGTEDPVRAARAAVLKFALAPLTGDSNPPVEQYATRLVDALVDAVQEAEHQRRLSEPILRNCIAPTCLRQFDINARMNGRPPERDSWSGEGWRTLTTGAPIHPGGGFICPDHAEAFIAHRPLRGEPSLPGTVDVRCTCAKWAHNGQHWHLAARGLWEEHFLDALDRAADNSATTGDSS